MAIERCGPGQDGTYYTMNAYDMTHIVGPLHKLMSSNTVLNGMDFKSVGIGDGGNEVGMGKMYNEIQNNSTVNHKEKV